MCEKCAFMSIYIGYVCEDVPDIYRNNIDAVDSVDVDVWVPMPDYQWSI